MSRLREVAIGLDQLANAVLGGYSGESISARCWRLRAGKPYGFLCRAVNWLMRDPDHCQASYQSVVDRRHAPAGYQAPPR